MNVLSADSAGVGHEASCDRTRCAGEIRTGRAARPLRSSACPPAARGRTARSNREPSFWTPRALTCVRQRCTLS